MPLDHRKQAVLSCIAYDLNTIPLWFSFSASLQCAYRFRNIRVAYLGDCALYIAILRRNYAKAQDKSRVARMLAFNG